MGNADNNLRFNTNKGNVVLLASLLVPTTYAQDPYGMALYSAEDVSVVTDDVDPCTLLPRDLISSVARRNAFTLFAEFIEPVPEKAPSFLVGSEMYDTYKKRSRDSNTQQSAPVLYVVGSIGNWPILGSALNYLWPDDQSIAAASGLLNVRYPTAYDQQLIDWILQQDDGSLTPADLFAEALEISGEQIETALLASHNALASIRTDPNRSETPLALKLVKASDTDNVGAWYHYFAAAYCTYRRPQPLYYKTGVIMEDVVSYFKEPLDSTERKAGLNGVDFGVLLRNELQSSSDMNP